MTRASAKEIAATRAARRGERLRDKERRQMEKLTAGLIDALSKYLSLHMGDPAVGRPGAFLDGPVIARLGAAASLRALLREKDQFDRINQAGRAT